MGIPERLFQGFLLPYVFWLEKFLNLDRLGHWIICVSWYWAWLRKDEPYFISLGIQNRLERIPNQQALLLFWNTLRIWPWSCGNYVGLVWHYSCPLGPSQQLPTSLETYIASALYCWPWCQCWACCSTWSTGGVAGIAVTCRGHPIFVETGKCCS